MLYVLLFATIYSYFAYPAVLMVLPKRRIQTSEHALPKMSLIVAAHNESSRIADKLKNSLSLDYPEDKLQVLVASDCSTDETDQIVRDTNGVTLVRADEHLGKEYAQSLAVQAATGDILVFSDTATTVPIEALRNLAMAFADPGVGAVSSEDKFLSDDGEIAGEGLYVKYEMWLRSLESQRAGLVGLSGSFFAARAEVCQEWDVVSPSDFNTALNCAKRGLVAISSPAVVGIYKDIKDPAKEYARKVRTVIRGMTAVARAPSVLNPFRFGLFSLQVWSHKIMRWLVPWFMLALLVATVVVAKNWFVVALLLGQLAFYFMAFLAWLIPSLRGNALVRIVFFFMQVNIAIAQAGVQFLSGKRITTWKPSVR